MDLVLSYDVDTTTREGRRRLRQVAKTCEGYGHRVHFSVFEVVVSETQYVKLIDALQHIVTAADSIRAYRLPSGGLDHVVALGAERDPAHREAWIV